MKKKPNKKSPLEIQNDKLNDPEQIQSWTVDQYTRQIELARQLYAEEHPEENARYEKAMTEAMEESYRTGGPFHSPTSW